MWEQWRRGWRKWTLLGGGGAFALVLILVGALAAGLLNRPVLWLAGRASGYEISCARLNGSLFSAFNCDNLAVSDRNGTFFVAKRAALAWKIAALLANRVSIQNLSVSDAKLTRFPKGGQSRSQGFLPRTTITLSHLDIAHLVLAAVKAKAACVYLAGTAEIGPSGFTSNLNLARCHPRKGEATLRSRYIKSTGKVAVSVTAQDDGLLLSQLFGLKRVGTTQLSLALSGTLPALNGVLRLRANKIGRVTATLQAKAPDQTQIDGDFAIDPDRLPGIATSASGQLSATVSYGAQRGVLVHLVTLTWGGFAASGELGANAQGGLYGNVALRSRVAHRLAGLKISDLELGLTLAGREAAPRLHARVTLRQIAATSIQITQLKAEVDAERQADGRLSLQLAGTATAARLPLQLSGLLGESVSFGAHLQRSARGRFKLQASLNGHAAEAKLTAALGLTKGAGLLSLRVPDLVKAKAGFGGSVVASLRLTNLTLGGTLEGIFCVNGGAISAKGLGLALGPSPSLTGRIAVQGKRYALSDLRLHLAGLSASGALSISSAGVLLGRVAVAHGELAPFASALHIPVAGKFALRARASGSLQAPIVALDVSAPRLVMGANLLRAVKLEMHATLAPRAQASLHVTAATALGPVALASTLAVHDQGWELAVSQGAIGPAKLAGTLARDHDLYSGHLRLSGDLLAPAGLLLGQKATGTGTILVEGLAHQLQLRAHLDHITVSSLTQARLTAMASLHALSGPVDFSAQLRQGANDLQVRAQALLAPFALRLTELQGQWSAIRFGLKAPTALQFGQGRFHLDRTLVSISGGELALAAKGGADQLQAEAQLRSLPVSPFTALLKLHHASGTLDGTLKVAFTQVVTAAHLALHGQDIALSSAAKPVEPAAFALTADWNGKVLTTAGRISGFSPAPATINLELPLLRRAGSFVPELAASGAISGQLRVDNLDAGHLSALLPLAEESAKGLLTADVNLGGDMAQPWVQGSLVITGGSFSDLRVGTRLTNLDAKLVAARGEPVAVQLTANDGGSGTINLSGRVLPPVARPGTPGHVTGELTVALNDAELIREDLIHGALSGALKVNLPASGPALISGRLRSDTVRIDLGAAIPPSIPTIKVRYVGWPSGPATRRRPRPARASAPEILSTARLDIGVDIPNRLYVAGRGLNSEWGGHLAIAGTIGRPAFRGRLQLINGSADVIGKSFTLQSGVVDISNALPGNANVNVTAQHASSTLTVTLSITGPATDPKISWSSVPALPKSEILSNLLFGSGTPQLSLGQAFELAQMSGALSSLGLGGGGDGGLLGFARNLTGLDVLNVTGPNTAQGTGASVTAGKYIGGKIYVGVTQGASTSASSAEVRIGVAPHVTVTGTVGANNANSLGVDWLWRY